MGHAVGLTAAAGNTSARRIFNKTGTWKGKLSGPFLSAPEERQQQDDWQWNAKKPQQSAFSECHLGLHPL
jgi:hypothetical protein